MNLVKAMAKAFQEMLFGVTPKPQTQWMGGNLSKPLIKKVVEVVPNPPVENKTPKVPHLILKSEGEMQEFMKNSGFAIQEYFFKRIQKAIQYGLSEVHMFNIGSAGYEVVVVEDDYPEALDKLQKHFIKTEQYERIKDCKQLLDKHNVNLLIRRSTIQ